MSVRCACDTPYQMLRDDDDGMAIISCALCGGTVKDLQRDALGVIFARINAVKLPAKKPKRQFGDPLPKKPLERDIRDAIRGAANRLPWCRLWLNRERKNEQGVWEAGLCPGSADLVGVVTNARTKHGRFVAIEVKTARKKTNTSDGQETWLALVDRIGGVAGVAWTPRMGMNILAEARDVQIETVMAELEAILGRTVTW